MTDIFSLSLLTMINLIIKKLINYNVKIGIYVINLVNYMILNLTYFC